MKFFAARMPTSELQRCLHHFGSGIAEIDPLGKIARSDGAELLSQTRRRGAREIRRGDVENFVGLTADGLHDLGMLITRHRDADASVEVEELIPVYVLDHGAHPAPGDQRVVARIGGREKLFLQIQNFSGLPGPEVES